MPQFDPGLPGLLVTWSQETTSHIEVHAEPNHSVCRSKGRRTVYFWDRPHGHKPVKVIVRYQRCKNGCSPGNTWRAALSEDHPKITKRLEAEIKCDGLIRPASQVAERTGVSQTLVRSLVSEALNGIDLNATIVVPDRAVLSIDDCHLFGYERIVLSDGHNSTIYGISDSKHRASVEALLNRIEAKNRVLAVSMDGGRGLLNAVKSVLPKAETVMDRWHVEKLVRDGLNQVRIQTEKTGSPKDLHPALRTLRYKRELISKPQGQLSENEQQLAGAIINLAPRLRAAYEAAQAFFALYNKPNKKQFILAYRAWRKHLTPELRQEFREAIRFIDNNLDAVGNYSKRQISNARAEANNRRIKDLKRISWGYSERKFFQRVIAVYGPGGVRNRSG